MNVQAPSLFVPPRPAAPIEEPGLYRFLIAVRTNALQIWSESAYEQDVVVGSALGRTRLLINAPDAIHRVLVDNTANYCRTSATIRILRPIVGEGRSSAKAGRHQRLTIAAAMAPRVVPMMARHVSLAAAETMAQLAALAARGPVDILATVQFLALEIAARSMFSLEMRQYGAALRRLITRFAGSLGRPYFLDLMLPAAIPTLRDFARMRFRSQWVAFMDEIIAARLCAPQADDGLCGKARDPVRHAACGARSRNREAFSRASLRDRDGDHDRCGHGDHGVDAVLVALPPGVVRPTRERGRGVLSAIDLGPDAAAAATKLPYTKAVVSEALRLSSAFELARMPISPD